MCAPIIKAHFLAHHLAYGGAHLYIVIVIIIIVVIVVIIISFIELNAFGHHQSHQPPWPL